jgi:hypothetical protein
MITEKSQAMARVVRRTVMPAEGWTLAADWISSEIRAGFRAESTCLRVVVRRGSDISTASAEQTQLSRPIRSVMKSLADRADFPIQNGKSPY